MTKAPLESLPDGANAQPSRHRYRDGLPAGTPLSTWAEAWLRVLLAQDGSATLLCESIARGPVALDVTQQQVSTQAPQAVTAVLGGSRFLERQVVLHHGGEVMMDNLTFVALDGLDPEVAALLTERRAPIGYIFARKSTKKRPVALDDAILERLFARCGVPDPEAVRSYVLDIDDRPCMLITETYRAGMRSGLPVG